MNRRRTSALLFVAIVVVATILPLASTDVWAVLTPLWLLQTTLVVTLVRRTAAACDEQPVALLSRLTARAPPHASLAL